MVDSIGLYNYSTVKTSYIRGTYSPRQTVSGEKTGQGQVLEEDCVTISPQAREKAKAEPTRKSDKIEERKPNGETLNDDEKHEVEKLRKRDTEVRTHEQAHLSAAGHLAAGGAQYTFKSGPDGQQYAVGGEVPLKVDDAPTPEEDLRNARQLERAALAPAKPSGQDRAIAAQARGKAAKAQQEIVEKQAKKVETTSEAPETKAIQSSQLAEQLGLSKNWDDKIDGVSRQDITGGQITFDRGDTGRLDVIA